MVGICVRARERAGGRARLLRVIRAVRVTRVDAAGGRVECRRSPTDSVCENPSVSNLGQAAGEGREERMRFNWLSTRVDIRFFSLKEEGY